MSWEQFILYPGRNASTPKYMTPYKGYLYFQARRQQDVELYRTDGTLAGTGLFADINAGNLAHQGSNPQNFTVFKDELYFTATDGIHGYEIFKTDGDTVMLLKDIYVGSGGSQTTLSENRWVMLEHNGYLYFHARDSAGFDNWNLWRTDGTEIGTTKVLDNNLSEIQGIHTHFKYIDGKFYYTKKSGFNTVVYQYDPDADINTELGIVSGDIQYLTAFDNKIFFSKNTEIFYTDGTYNNAVASYINVINIGPVGGAAEFKPLGANLIFVASSASKGLYDLYKLYYEPTLNEYHISLLYDFNENGTNSLDPFRNQVNHNGKDIFYELNGKLYFNAYEETSPQNGSVFLNQIYATDGTNTQVAIPLENVLTDTGIVNTIYKITPINNKLYFMMQDMALSNIQLWEGNPLDSSITRLTSMDSLSSPESIAYEHDAGFNDIIAFNEAIYISGFTETEEKELWRYYNKPIVSNNDIPAIKKISCHPNPTSGIVTIDLEPNNKYTIEVYNVLGQKMSLIKINNNQIDFSKSAPGLYHIVIYDREQQAKFVSKIIKQ